MKNQEITTNVQAKELNYDSYENEVYDEDIRRSIPGYEELHKELETAIKKYSQNNDVKKILELGVGTGISTEKVLRIIPQASLTVIDFSEQMMEGAKKRLSSYNVKYILGDYSEIPFEKDFDIIISVIGIHHQTNEGKKKLFKKIAQSLKPGGIFFFGDLVTHNDKKKAAITDAKHYHHLVNNARNEKSLEEWAHHHKFLNILAPLEQQIQWLKEAGFRTVTLNYEHLNTALLTATK